MSEACGWSNKYSMIVLNSSRVVLIKTSSQYDSRVINYDRRAFILLADVTQWDPLEWNLVVNKKSSVGNLIKDATIVIYDSRVVKISNRQYAFRVVNYDHKLFIVLAIGYPTSPPQFSTYKTCPKVFEAGSTSVKNVFTWLFVCDIKKLFYLPRIWKVLHLVPRPKNVESVENYFFWSKTLGGGWWQ